MSLANRIIQQSEQHSHYVQFYKADEPLLNRNVGYYLWDGFLRGDGMVVIATPQRQLGLVDHLERLGLDTTQTRHERQLILLDAEETLDRFMVNGMPDHTLFQRAIDEVLRHLHAPSGSPRGYGEMVGLLWERRQFDAAILLEEYWNKVLRANGMTIFCGYPIDIFGDDLESARMRAVLGNHTHLMPTGADGTLDDAVNKAIHEVLGPNADALRLPVLADNSGNTALLQPAEASIVWLRKNLPDRADEILSRARNYYALCAA